MRNNLIGVLGVLFVVCLPVSGKDKNQTTYPSATISAAMKKDAFAVYRNFEQEFELIDYGKAIEKVHLVITILENNGAELGKLVLPYDKSTHIKGLTGRSYNALGLPDDKMKSSDIQDVNYTSSGAIYDDLRLKIAEINPDSYPYTVEYNYEIEYDGLIAYPEFRPLNDYRLSVEKSSFRITWPDNLKFRYREQNLPTGCRTEKSLNGKNTIEWKLDSLTAWKEEPKAPQLQSQTPGVILGPTKFIFFGSSGELNTWQEYGKWVYGLIKGLDQLPDARQSEIRKMVGEVKDTIRAIETLYKYMQNRTRYVGIQMGLGGLKPFPAETVDRLGYGDCKALSNYMKALLNCVDIHSLYVEAGAGPSQGITLPDFATENQTNHIVLCVPLKKDSVWLECTSQTDPSGYAGTFTAGKQVLLITPEGGKLARIPLMNGDQTSQKRTAEVTINPTGLVHVTTKTNYSGYSYEDVSSNLTESKKEQEKEILSRLAIPGITLHSFEYQEKQKIVPEVNELIDFSSDLYLSKTGSRLFVPLNILNQKITVPSKIENRKMPVRQRIAYTERDSLIFKLPEGYETESSPKNKNIKSDFGEYTTRLTSENGQVFYVRELKVYKGDWPKEKYQELTDFYTAVSTSDKNKLVLKQKLQ
jgi:hypothetical protein